MKISICSMLIKRIVLRRVPVVFLALLIGLPALGCGGSSDSDPSMDHADAGLDADETGADAGYTPNIPLPAPPAPPMFTNWMCPKGWLPEKVLVGTPEEHSICQPPPLPASCPDGMMPVIGQTDCQPIGDPCPTGAWPAGLPAGTIVYVQAGATGGNGLSKAAPLGSIGAAVAAAPSGAVIAIAKGTYVEAVTVTKTLTLWGACVMGVRIEGPPGALTDTAINVELSGDVAVRNVTVTGARSGISVYNGATLHGAGIRVVATTGVGILAWGGILDLNDVAVTETQALPDGTFGRGLDVVAGAHATVKRAIFDRNREIGVLAREAGTELELTDVVVKDTQSQNIEKQLGCGLSVQASARATVQRAIFDHNRDVGVRAVDTGTDLTLTDVVVKDTQSRDNDKYRGDGLGVQGGARAKVERAVFDHNREVGIFAAGSTTELALTDVIVKNTQSRESNKQAGGALSVETGAHTSVERGVFDHNRTVGISVGVAAAKLTATDLVVKDTQSQESDKQFGKGLELWGSARAVVQRAVFDHNRYMGVAAADAGTVLSLADVVVKDTQSQESDMQGGRGLEAQEGATVMAERAVFDHNREIGAFAIDSGTVLALIDVVVKDTQSQENDKRFGIGLGVQEGAHATVERAVFDHNRESGVLGQGASTELVLTDVIVKDTQSQESDKQFGGGLAVHGGMHVTVKRAVFDHNRDVGVSAMEAGTEITLSDVVVRDTQPRDDQGEYGVGVGAVAGATLHVQSSLIVGSSVAGILAMDGAQVTVSSCEIVATLAGSITLVGPDGNTLEGPRLDDIGDGILIVGDSSATLTDLRVADCARAGILFDEGSGSLTRVISTANRFGLVLQGSRQPTYDQATCDFTGNQESIVPDEDLPVPNAPLDVPKAP